MRDLWIRTLAMAVALCVILAPCKVFADDATVTGVVSVTRNDDDAITAVQLTADGVAYNITLDAKGEALAALKGTNVQVTGTIVEQEGARWITVTSFKPAGGD